MAEIAKVLKKTVNKGKLKKSIKNVLCRPDPVFWPVVSEENAYKLEVVLNQHKIKVLEYKKPHWNEIKAIAKENRPKAPKIPKVDGLIFGISECLNAIEKLQCSSFIIDAAVNPQTIVQPILEKCYSNKIPVLCMNNLRKVCADNFGIPTSCLGVASNSLLDLHTLILNVAKEIKYPQTLIDEIDKSKMDLDTGKATNISQENTLNKSTISEFQYLYRTDKKTRIFMPSEGTTIQTRREFAGHDFIKFPNKKEHRPPNKIHMKMILKKIANNPSREKRKKNDI